MPEENQTNPNQAMTPDRPPGESPINPRPEAQDVLHTEPSQPQTERQKQKDRSTLDTLLAGTNINLDDLPDHVQAELRKYNIVSTGSAAERAVADRLFNYLFGLDQGVVSEEQHRQLLSNAAQIKEGYETLGHQRGGDVLERIAESSSQAAEVQKKSLERNLITPSPEDMENPQAWIRLIFSEMQKAEVPVTDSEASDVENRKIWERIFESLEQMPDRMGGEFRPDPNTQPQLYRLYEHYKKDYPEGIYLKEKLIIYVRARRALHNRYEQVLQADGDLQKLGGGEKQYRSNINNITPDQEMLIIHTDDFWRPDVEGMSLQEQREIAANVDAGWGLWWSVGRRGKSSYPGLSVSFNDTLNSADRLSDLRTQMIALMQRRAMGGNASVELSERLFRIWLTDKMLDPNLKSFAGSPEVRNIMYQERKRLNDYVNQGKDVKLEWTIGRYFYPPVKPHNILSGGEAVNAEAEYGQDLREKIRHNPDVIKARISILKRNYQRSAFNQGSIPYPMGEFVGDRLHSMFVVVPTVEFDQQEGVFKKGIVRKKMSTYVVDLQGNYINGGLKSIPFLGGPGFGGLSEDAYSNYFSFFLTTAKDVEDLITRTDYKEEEIKGRDIYVSFKDKAATLGIICPWLNTLEDEFRAAALRNSIKRYFSDVDNEGNEVIDGRVLAISTFSSFDDLSKYGFNDVEIQRIRSVFGFEGGQTENTLEPLQLPEPYKNLIQEASVKAAEYQSAMLDVINLNYDIGVFWTGSLAKGPVDKKGVFKESMYEIESIRTALEQIKVTGQLSREAYDLLIYEAMEELKFGSARLNSIARRIAKFVRR